MTNFSKPCPAIKDPDGACVHETDCEWEKWTVCAIDPMSVADAVTFVACMDNANETDASAAAEGCAASTFDAVKACHDGSQGEALLGAASKQYLAAIAGEAHAFIPDVFINNVRACVLAPRLGYPTRMFRRCTRSRRTRTTGSRRRSAPPGAPQRCAAASSAAEAPFEDRRRRAP